MGKSGTKLVSSTNNNQNRNNKASQNGVYDQSESEDVILSTLQVLHAINSGEYQDTTIACLHIHTFSI